ncbi:4Fe-4S ferredoxin N-terminal domain-containing protein [Halomicrobium katesii]|uniref:4Fe-4S ferredoxin N-terminal domain-containing protein n=1 Tax=Halomicrobium katesii TaxID=437163 RepID=UPI00037A441D|nr:4Fe-4S ferredoxin N-terminal domain-containing protein [Halomicrobium katesii]
MTKESRPAHEPIPEWDEAADEILDGCGYDPDLGKRMAEDAIKITNGELTEQEFHEKYHEEVKTEFGTDERPTKPEGFDD